MLISYINLSVPTPLETIVCRLINVWNSLPTTMDFSTINAFRRAISDVDLTEFLVLTHDTSVVSLIASLFTSIAFYYNNCISSSSWVQLLVHDFMPCCYLLDCDCIRAMCICVL